MYCTVGSPVINVAKLGDGQCVVRTGGGGVTGGIMMLSLAGTRLHCRILESRHTQQHYRLGIHLQKRDESAIFSVCTCAVVFDLIYSGGS